MRTALIILVCIVAVVSCKTNDNKAGNNTSAAAKAIDTTDSTKFTTVQWLDSLVDFGSVNEGENANILFHFKNTGNKPLVIANVVAGCGCTVPEYTQEPVMPGNSGFVKAVFHSSGQPPTVHKTVTVGMNTKEQTYTLAFIGEVKK